MGAYHGQRSFDAFSHSKAVLHRVPHFDAPMRYPPFTPLKQSMLGFLTQPQLARWFDRARNIVGSKDFVIAFLAALLMAPGGGNRAGRAKL